MEKLEFKVKLSLKNEITLENHHNPTYIKESLDKFIQDYFAKALKPWTKTLMKLRLVSSSLTERQCFKSFSQRNRQWMAQTNLWLLNTTQKMKISIKDSFSKCDQIRRELWIWSHSLKKSLMENLIFCVVKLTKWNVE